MAECLTSILTCQEVLVDRIRVVAEICKDLSLIESSLHLRTSEVQLTDFAEDFSKSAQLILYLDEIRYIEMPLLS